MARHRREIARQPGSPLPSVTIPRVAISTFAIPIGLLLFGMMSARLSLLKGLPIKTASIVIPVYNELQTIAQILDRVRMAPTPG
jgi:hypothetical protein